jgi:hypothetical protein
VTKSRLSQAAISHRSGEGVLGVGAPLGGRHFLQALKEAHGFLPDLFDASDLDCLLYKATSWHQMRTLASIE